MHHKNYLCSICVLILFVACHCESVSAQGVAKQRKAGKAAFDNGNYKYAYNVFHKLCLDEGVEPGLVGGDLSLAVQCLASLGREKEFDQLLESAIEVHSDNWRLLRVAAGQYLNGLNGSHHGYIISGKFQRGPHRGGGRLVNARQRDRIRALQLMQTAIPLANEDKSKADVSNFYIDLAAQLLYLRGQAGAWRLLHLSNLEELPDYDEGYDDVRNWHGAPVNEDGEPIFHKVAKSWDTATTDGERWRWCLDQATKHYPQNLNRVRLELAQFLQSQFGVQTMQYGRWGAVFNRFQSVDDATKIENGAIELHTLKETESIAKLASGIKRFDLPDEFNHIKIFQKVAAEPKTGHGQAAIAQLTTIFTNRQQYPQAVKYLRQDIKQYGKTAFKRKHLETIIGNWGAFETIGSQTVGKPATLKYRYRNGHKVRFTAHEVQVTKLLNDVKRYLKRDPQTLDSHMLNISNFSRRLLGESHQKYIGRKAATWGVKLKPRPDHFDQRIDVTAPVEKPGTYLVTAELEGGNTCRIVLWLSDTAIVKKQLADRTWYFVGDAETGEPVAKANLEFFGWTQKTLKSNRYQILTSSFKGVTDNDGQFLADLRDLKPNYQWVIIATTRQGRFAYLGFQGVWQDSNAYQQEYNQRKSFGITDRPVYRPGDEVQFKFWTRDAKYDLEDVSQYAQHSFGLNIYNPKGESVLSKILQTDDYGGFDGTWKIPSDATLGEYSISADYGAVSFRVEEYRKPEFEVTIKTPSEPVMVGDKITATINAKYYFGSPVTGAKVKYKVIRNAHSQNWYPGMPWDWCYGPGYWWFSRDYPWYRGWNDWVGCLQPAPMWWHGTQQAPPEIVIEDEVEIGDDGMVNVNINTDTAKTFHGDTDHRYTITAEVRDASRRTIVGTGTVLVARNPFKIFTWTNRGHFEVGDTIQADFRAMTVDRKPVPGEGLLTLMKITYDNNQQPVETAVRRWELDTNAEGAAMKQIRAAANGQYRLSYQLEDAAGREVEGGYLFTITGDGYDGANYRFNAVELIPDSREYSPGDKVRLQINTNRNNGTVALFIRPSNGVYLPPKIVRLKGKSTITEIKVTRKDMPNFFVEAVTVAGGRVHQVAKEIVVPPQRRVLNVEVLPSKADYKPGEKAKARIHVTDHTGENFTGSLVVAIYDKSVEYVSGGSNVGDIKEFFWQWRRHHNPHYATSLDRWFGDMTTSRSHSMRPLGIFGATLTNNIKRTETTRSLSRELPPEVAGTMIALADDSGDGAVSMRGSDVAELVQPTIRRNFADTAFWKATLTTDKTGVAEIELDMPENLTTWKIKAWAVGHGTRVGEAEAEVITRKDLIVRLQSPRFFVQKDEVVLSANVHNYLDEEKEVTVSLELPNDLLAPVDGVESTVTTSVPSGGETRVDWRVAVKSAGAATVRINALTDVESDALEMKFPCYIHGALKTQSWTGTVRPDDENASITINIPEQRLPEQSRLEIRYSPTLAGAMIDALPYLVDYPYGCTEQTLNRFLPTVITQKALVEMGVDLAAVREVRTNLNSQEIGDAHERAMQWQRYDKNPVFDRTAVDAMVKKGVGRLASMQVSDGGWGWFSGWGEQSYPHTTAVVVHGLQVARDNGALIADSTINRGIDWLKQHQRGEVQKIRNAPKQTSPNKSSAEDLDALVYMILIDAGIDNKEMRELLYRDRKNLSVYSKAIFGMALHKAKDQEKLDMIMENLSQFLVQDEENETAYLKLPGDRFWWYWYGSEIEANAYYLKLLSRTDPNGTVAPRLVKYLLNNRKHATYWRSTRDTAVCVEALADYLRASGEDNPDMTVEVWLDGEKKKEIQINAENLFSFDNQFLLTGKDLTSGNHEIEIRRQGRGPVYFNAYLSNFSLEDKIAKAGLEVKVSRKFYKLDAVGKQLQVSGSRGQVLNRKVEKYERKELQNLATLSSGDLVEVELSIESKNDYEYVIFEDMKAAGFEPVEVRSGYTNNDMGAYVEFRDNRVSFFIRHLARGNHSLRYRLRAEIPGKFSALPARAYAMYAPELKGNSGELKLSIED